MSRPTPQQWQSFLHREIPITQAQGIEVVRLDARGIELRAPLALNHNDKASGFAGSLFSLAVLAGWSQVMLLLDECGIVGQAVVSKSEVRFLAPAKADFSARAEHPGAAQLAEFRGALQSKGRTRLPLEIAVEANSKRVMILAARYAAVTG